MSGELANKGLGALAGEAGRGKSPSRDVLELDDGHRGKRARVDGAQPEVERPTVSVAVQPVQLGDSAQSSRPPLLTTSPLFRTTPLPNPFSPARSRFTVRLRLEGETDTSFQDATSFLNEMDPTDLDFLTSSDVRNEQSRELRRLGHAGGLALDADSVSDAVPQHYIADDSGIFMGDLPSDELESGKGGSSTPMVEEDSLVTLGDEMDFDGDEMWEGFEDDAAYEVETVQGARRINKKDILSLLPKDPSQQQDDDEDYNNGPDPYDQPFDASFQPTFKFARLGTAVVFSDAALKKAEALFIEEEDKVEEVKAAPTTTTAFVGFTTTKGVPIALSEAALARARRLVCSSPPTADEPLPPARSLFTRPSFTRPTDPTVTTSMTTPAAFVTASGLGGFTSGAGAVIAGPTEEGLRMAAAALDRDVFGVSPSVASIPAAAFRLAPQPSQHGDDNMVVESPTTNRTAHAVVSRPPILALDNGGQSSYPSSPVRRVKPRGKKLASPPPAPVHHNSSPQVLPAESPIQMLAPPPRPVESTPSKAPSFRPPTLATRTPIASTSKILLPRPASTTPAFRVPLLRTGSATKTTPLKATPALRRLNFGMTPRARPNPPNRFSTPFKGGVRPVGLTPAGITSAQVSVSKGKGKAVPIVREDLQAVFDLTLPVERVSLRILMRPRPQTHLYEYLESLGLPEEVLGMDSKSAISFIFDCGRGDKSALEQLLRDDCSLATLPWVKNHWSLVIWKLASLVRTRPELLTQYWTWEVAVNQLKYRYEREINNAQRSCIKRVQEQDSPSTLPMVLCVSEIRWAEASETDTLKEDEEPLLVIVGLELTDGWYRIRATMDGTLRSAVERGKICLGCKLTVIGARIESSRDGTEVLEALTRSSITISGNSTSLAPWDAKLGFTQTRCIASLDTLTSSGGVISLLDIIIERVFPYGYVDLRKNSQHGTWNEAEERLQAEAWEKGRAKAQGKLAEELERTDGEWDVIVHLLRDRAMRVGAPSPSSSSAVDEDGEEPDEILDRIDSAADKASIIRQLSARQVHACLALACENAAQEKQSAVSDLEKDLATSFPPRDVRGFRVLRIRDARSNEGKAVSSRTAQLTVWDAKVLGDGFFKEGQRHLVSNLAPKGSWKRIASEITLATRRDSRWQLHE